MDEYGEQYDSDGRLWRYDRRERIWYAPDYGDDWGVFDTLAEVAEEYGPMTATAPKDA